MADAQAGRAIPVTSDNAEQARAKVLLEYPGAQTSVVRADEMEGCNRALLLWERTGLLGQFEISSSLKKGYHG